MKSSTHWIFALAAAILCLLPQLSGSSNWLQIVQSDNKATLYAASSTNHKSSTTPLKLSPGPQLLVDDYLIESSTNLRRVVNRPQRDPTIPNPIITGKEDGNFQPYMTVLRDSATKRFRMWYGARTEPRNSMESRLAYVESKDGIHWDRPHRLLDTPFIQFGVSLIDEGVAFPNPDTRYKFGWHAPSKAVGSLPASGSAGLKIASSPNGLTWNQMIPQGASSDVVLEHDHDINGIFRDPLRNRYAAIVSTYTTGQGWSGRRRVTMQSVSNDLLHWSKPWYIVTPDDKREEGETQFYAMDGFLIRGGLWIGMVKVLHDEMKADNPPDPPDAQGVGWTSLAWSRDGEHWVRDPEPFFERDLKKGAWDHAHAWIDEQLPVGDQVYLYYAGYARGHKVNRFEERQIGLLRMQRDRYVAREAGVEGGGFRTPLIHWNGGSITLNADALKGEIRMQALDAAGKPIPGFTFSDCQPISADGLDLPVKWKGALSKLKGKNVRLEFSLKNARMFAFDLTR